MSPTLPEEMLLLLEELFKGVDYHLGGIASAVRVLPARPARAPIFSQMASKPMTLAQPASTASGRGAQDGARLGGAGRCQPGGRGGGHRSSRGDGVISRGGPWGRRRSLSSRHPSCAGAPGQAEGEPEVVRDLGRDHLHQRQIGLFDGSMGGFMRYRCHIYRAGGTATCSSISPPRTSTHR